MAGERAALCWGLFAAVALTLAAGRPAAATDGRYQRAVGLSQRREYAGALALLDSIGTDSLAQALACRINLVVGDYRSALLEAARVSVLWPATEGGRAASWQSAYSHERLGLYDDAIAGYRAAAAGDSSLAGYARFRIGRCLAKKMARPGRAHAAGDAYRPDSPGIVDAAAVRRQEGFAAGRGAGARPAALRQAARLVRRKRYDAARKLLEGFIRSNPGSGYRAEAAYQVAKGWERQGRLVEALAAYRRASTADGGSRWPQESAFRHGWCQLKLGDTVAALASWQELRNATAWSEPRSAALYWSAKLWQETGDSLSAQSCRDQLLRHDGLGFYGLRAGGRPVNMAERSDTATDCETTDDPDSCAVLGDGNFLLARRLAGYGLAGDAVAVLSRLETWYGGDPRSLRHISRTYAECGRDDRAIDAALRALRLHPDRPPAELLRLAFPRSHLGTISRHSTPLGLDPALVLAVIHKESRFQEKVRSRAGARGLMQIMPATGRLLSRDRRFKADRLYDPVLSIDFGTRFLARLLDEFDQSWPQALAAYNAGPARVRQWLNERRSRADDDFFLEEIFIPETKRYIMVVMQNYYQYRRLLEEEGA